MLSTVRHNHFNFFVGDDRPAVAHQGEKVTNIWVGKLPQEVWQFHNVRVCVVQNAVACVRHVDSPFGCMENRTSRVKRYELVISP